eukprot:s2890_g6.t1
MSGNRQWQGRGRNEEEDEDEEDSSYQSGGRSSGYTERDSRKGSAGPPPTYDGSREPGVFEEYRIRARLWLFSTNLENRARGPRLMQSLTGKAFESVKHLIDDQQWLDSPDNGEKLIDLLARPEYYGKEELESLYHAMHKLFYSDLRKDDDDLPAFRSRFEQAVRKIKKHHVSLPPEALGFLFLKQSKITGESLERLITLTNGDLKFDSVVDALRKIKMRLLDGEESSKKRHVWVQDSIDERDDSVIDDNSHGQDDDEIDLIEGAIAELDGEDSSVGEVTEGGAREILMTLIKNKISKPQVMSYKQVQQQKREVKNSRGFRPVGNASNAGNGTMRRDLQQLKAVTRCKSCGELGHWHRECPNKSVGKPNAAGSVSASSGGSTAHGWWSIVQPVEPVDPSESQSEVLHQFPSGFVKSTLHTPLVSKACHNEPCDAQNMDCPANSQHVITESFPAVLEEGYAIMDTGCQRSAIGLNTLQRLQQLLPKELSVKFMNRKFRFAGIGGETVTNRVAMLPVCFGRRPGVVHAAVLEDTPDAPFLLSLPILKALESQELSETRGSKRACTGHSELKPRHVSTWMRMANKLRIQYHVELMLKVLISLSMPLMFILKKVLAMMMRVAEIEEMEVLQDLMENMIQEKKNMEKGKHVKKSQKASSTGSFELISAGSEVSWMGHQKQRHHQTDRGASSSSQMTGYPHHQDRDRRCFCGLEPVLLTCRKEGMNFMRRFYRCPKSPNSGSQCQFFQWTEDTKAEEYEKLYASQNASSTKSKKSKSTKKQSESTSESESSDCDRRGKGLKGSPTSRKSPKHKPMSMADLAGCNHQWNRRGTNDHQSMRTCTLCGLEEKVRYRDGKLTQRWVDVSNMKKSGRPRAASP